VENRKNCRQIQNYTEKIKKVYMTFTYQFLTSLVAKGVHYLKINLFNVLKYKVRTFTHDIKF
jgi:hypothetical protein